MSTIFWCRQPSGARLPAKLFVVGHLRFARSDRNRRQTPNGSSWYHRWLNGATMRKLIFSLCLLLFSTNLVAAQQYDLVLEGGRVMDPETGLDAVRNVGIRDGKIVRVSSEALLGRRVIHASGLVVAPGFIDLHQHGQELASQRVKAHVMQKKAAQTRGRHFTEIARTK